MFARDQTSCALHLPHSGPRFEAPPREQPSSSLKTVPPATPLTLRPPACGLVPPEHLLTCSSWSTSCWDQLLKGTTGTAKDCVPFGLTPPKICPKIIPIAHALHRAICASIPNVQCTTVQSWEHILHQRGTLGPSLAYVAASSPPLPPGAICGHYCNAPAAIARSTALSLWGTLVPTGTLISTPVAGHIVTLQ